MQRFLLKARVSIIAFAACAATCMHAQDTRTVTEPNFPTVCTQVASQLAIVGSDPASETQFDTARVQSALNLCPSGQAVELQASGTNSAFLMQPFSIPNGITLIIDGGVTLYASRNPADYQISGGETCGTIGTKGGGCGPLITVNSGNASSGAGLMGYGVIDGRGNEAPIVSGIIGTQNWWDITTSDSTSRTQNKPVLLNAGSASNFTLYQVTFRNAPYFNVQWSGTGFTAWGVKTNAPGSAPNTDGIDPAGSNVTINNAFLSDGDDMIAVKASNAVANITVSNTNTFSGHGISVGSQTSGGLTNMLVTNINQYGDGLIGGGIGIRLKSDPAAGGLVQNVTYQNICSTNVDFPIVIDPNYDGRTGTLIPTFQNILYRNYHSTTNGKFQWGGYDATHLATVTFDNVIIDGLTQAHITPAMQDIAITLGPGPVTSLLTNQTGTAVTYSGSVTNPTEAAYPCASSNFNFLPSYLYLSSGTTQNRQTLSIAAPGTVTLNAIVQTAKSQLSYISYEGTTYTGVPAPTAGVAFFEGTKQVATANLGANGTLASATLTGVTAGTHTYTAQYLGDTNYAAFSFGSVTVTVASNSTTTTLSTTPTAIFAGESFNLIASVTGQSGTPTGTVAFNGSTSLGSATLSSGKASLPVSGLAAGSYSFTATYSGDGNNAASTSTAFPVQVVPAFIVIATPSSLTLAPGAAGSFTLAVTPASGFTGTPSYTCTTTASYVSCSVSNATTTSATVSIAVAATVGAVHNEPSLLWYAALLPFGLLARRRRKLWAGVSLVALFMIVGCGGGSGSSSATPQKPPAGAQTATVTATSTTGGIATTQAVQLTVNVTN